MSYRPLASFGLRAHPGANLHRWAPALAHGSKYYSRSLCQLFTHFLMAAAALRTAARHLAAPAAVCGALASIAPPQRTRCNEHDERLANLKAEVMLLRGENARLRRALDGGSLDVEALRLRIADFARERDWDQFHTPRNILLAPVWKSIIEQAARRWRGG